MQQYTIIINDWYVKVTATGLHEAFWKAREVIRITSKRKGLSYQI